MHTILADEFQETQQGTLHFHYLKADEFGLLHVARTFDEHAEQLEESLRGEGDDGRNERFLRRFVRPLGLDRSASEPSSPRRSRSSATRPRRRPTAAPCSRLPSGSRSRRSPGSRAAPPSAGCETRAAKQTPTAELMRIVRKRALHRTGAPVVAGPWLGRRDRRAPLLDPVPAPAPGDGRGPEGAAVRRPPRSRGAAWYAGIGAGQVDLERLIPDEPPEEVTEDELQGPLRDEIARTFGFGSRAFRVLPAGLVAATREAIADQKPSDRKRLLEFEPLRPAAYAARAATSARTGPRRSSPCSAASTRRRSRPSSSLPDPHDLKVVSSFLGRPPFGRLTLDEGTPEQRAAQLLESQGALAAV